MGGLESTLFANELFEMYQNYAMYKGWSFNVEKTSYSEVGKLGRMSYVMHKYEYVFIFLF